MSLPAPPASASARSGRRSLRTDHVPLPPLGPRRFASGPCHQNAPLADSCERERRDSRETGACHSPRPRMQAAGWPVRAADRGARGKPVPRGHVDPSNHRRWRSGRRPAPHRREEETWPTPRQREPLTRRCCTGSRAACPGSRSTGRGQERHNRGPARSRAIALLEDASADSAVRAVVLTATGDGFCTGADLHAGRRASPPKPKGAPERIIGDAARMIRRGAQRLIGAVLDCEKPVIAAVNGTAAGIGAHLAYACDLVITAESARFIEVFVRRGIAPDGAGAYLLPASSGRRRPRSSSSSATTCRPADAHGLGLVGTRSSPTTSCRERPRRGRIAWRRSQPRPWGWPVAGEPLPRKRPHGRVRRRGVAQELVVATANAAKELQAFAERRKPEFRGF